MRTQAGLIHSTVGVTQAVGTPALMLTEQYRMHPDVRAFPSSFFYQGRLTDSASVRARATPSFLQRWPFLPCVPALVLARCSLLRSPPTTISRRCAAV